MRMDYDLAESLMDAGFPQIGKGSLIGPMNKLVWRSGDRVYVPTLEELIEACGDGFESLERGMNTWFCNDTFLYDGTTPVEAVARLWLALNRK